MQIEESIRVAIYGLRDHKFRSFLTMLGIIFGTASVIAMISIGEDAKKQAMAISITGGLIGVFPRIVLSLTIGLLTEVKTSLTLYSIFIAFGFSVIVGVTFGYLPAKRAADLKPIESIRHE